uniref:Glyceraldehyde-3-phosphate dehydrogenase n=1 Tax=Myotis lucifugus TaxID=59463 RepID=G1Q2J7_MYOLU
QIFIFNFNSPHVKFKGTDKAGNGKVVINEKSTSIFQEPDSANFKWEILVLIHWCHHLKGRSRRVIISAPVADPMFVMGVNHDKYDNSLKIVRNASCTTLRAKVIHDKYSILKGLRPAVHAITATEKTVEDPSGKLWHDGRGAAQHIIPASTGTAKAVGKVITDLNGKFTGMAFYVPTPNVLVFYLISYLKKTVKDDIKKVVKQAGIRGS